MTGKYYTPVVKKALMKYREKNSEEYKNYMKNFMKEYRIKNREKCLVHDDNTRIRNNLSYEAKVFMKKIDPFLFNY